jgi:beta-lactamase superfamily II metal-dependent hydrolase
MIGFSRWAAELPGLHAHFALPEPVHVIAAYALIGLAFASLTARKEVRRFTLPSLSAAALVWTALGSWDRTAVELTILPLGGAGIYIDGSGTRDDLLIDPGNDAAARSMVGPFLQARGINRIPNVLLTHGDVQHVGGWGALNEKFGIAQAAASPVQQRSAPYRQVLRAVEQAGPELVRVSRDMRLSGWDVLHPAIDDRFSSADDAAVVLRRDFEGLRVLLLSDLGRSGQRALLEREPDLQADLVVAGLPNRDEPLGRSLIEAIAPKVVIVASSEYPAAARGGRLLRARLEAFPATVFYTSDLGALTVRLANGRMRIETADRTILVPEQGGSLNALENAFDPPVAGETEPRDLDESLD